MTKRRAPPPMISLSNNDKRLLKILGGLVLRSVTKDGEHAPASVAVELSDEEADHLLKCIEHLLESREFLERSYFIEVLTGKFSELDDAARGIFYRMRGVRGGSRMYALPHWNQFCLRFGIDAPSSLNGTISPMNYDEFLELEEKLIDALEVHPRVKIVWLKIIKRLRRRVGEIRKGKKTIGVLRIRRIFYDLAKSMERSRRFPRNGVVIERNRLIGMMTVISNGSVMFTTRDWGVAGTISTIAGASVMSLKE